MPRRVACEMLKNEIEQEGRFTRLLLSYQCHCQCCSQQQVLVCCASCVSTHDSDFRCLLRPFVRRRDLEMLVEVCGESLGEDVLGAVPIESDVVSSF